MIDSKRLEDIKTKIVNTVSPEKIILFGSYARGNATEESDIDLLIVWNTDLGHHERNLYLDGLFDNRDFPLDIFAFTGDEFERFKDMPGTMLYEASHYGKVIYG
ncbi:MAG: nucleotidyltransferase domain-containing protein [Nitrospirae bacterium]|nr:nucleotidyltransferase domain-containing protein [Nitrospirota bacterium]